MFTIKDMILKLTHFLLGSACCLLLSACTSNGGESRSASFTEIKDEYGNVTHQCTMERATGTRVGARICRTMEQIEDERRTSQEAVIRNQRVMI